jgi:hypothetical protein
MLDCNVPVRRKQNRRLVPAQPLASRIWGMVVIRTCRAKSGRIIAPMTQARTASSGVVTPPPLQHWLHAVLVLFVELVQGVATTLGMRRRIGRRDWHTQSDVSALPQAKDDTQLRETNPAATSGPIVLMVNSARSARPSNHEDVLILLQHPATRTSTPPPNGGGAARTPVATSAFRWGTALTTRTDRTRRTTATHPSRARCAHLARSASPGSS